MVNLVFDPQFEVSKPLRRTLLIHRIWPVAVVAFASIITVAWACMLGYGLVYIGGRLLSSFL
jgi:hypothetical protein